MPQNGDESGIDDVNIADAYLRFGAWLVSAGTLVVVLIPVVFFIFMYDMGVVQHPMRRARGYGTRDIAIVWAVPVVCVLAYGNHQVYRQITTGQSLGMSKVGIKIASVVSGGRIALKAACLRMVMPPLCAVPGVILAILTGLAGFLWLAIAGWLLCPISSLWGQMGRGWHDRLAGTVLLQSDSKHLA